MVKIRLVVCPCLFCVVTCDSDPCHGYTCDDTPNGFECQCEDGFTGKTCDIPPDYCINNLCLNNATCVSGSDNYTCQCAAGFRGHYCQEEIGKSHVSYTWG